MIVESILGRQNGSPSCFLACHASGERRTLLHALQEAT